jgi:hypothetical protein
MRKSTSYNTIYKEVSIYLEEATQELKKRGEFRKDLIPHVSPLGWEHINFLGEYNFDVAHASSLCNLRPLIKKKPVYS